MPGGAHVGHMIHALFERVPFALDDGKAIASEIEALLDEFGIDRQWASALERMRANVLDTVLDGERMRLRDLAPDQCVPEMEFTCAVGATQAQVMREALRPLGAQGSRLPEAIGRTVLAPQQGFIRGFIDLVFEHRGRYYILDYKSNWLGDALDDYVPARLEQAMAEHWYDFQYLLYAVALHRHLSLCVEDYDYDRHFGGVYYLFVRGMRVSLGASRGVYATRPPRALIEALDASMRNEDALL
jgi:exodeoxyribonuclease V beta subunit